MTATTVVDAEMDAALEEGIVVAGRRFRRAATTTFEHDAYTMRQLRDSGLLTVAQRFDPLHDDINDLTTTVIVDAFSSGKLFTLLAAVLVEDTVKWSLASAEANAAFFRGLTDPTDKAELRAFIPWALLNFFLNADASWRTFLKYSRGIGSADADLGSNPSHAGVLTTESGTT